jgi:hypothetical protein
MAGKARNLEGTFCPHGFFWKILFISIEDVFKENNDGNKFPRLFFMIIDNKMDEKHSKFFKNH